MSYYYNPNGLKAPSFASNDFQVHAQDGSVMCARSVGLLGARDCQIITHNRKERFESTAPNGAKGTEWTSKYGFVGGNIFHENRVAEGLNEKGLSFSALVLEETKYANVPLGEEGKALAAKDVGHWILGNFATVAKVKEAINNVIIWDQSLGLHFALHDKNGDNGVIEIIEGKIKLHDNQRGVLTNDPELPKQLDNLLHYSTITPKGGLRQLPGGWSTAERFAHLAKMMEFSNPANKAEAFDEATHVLNTMDIPMKCAVREENDRDVSDATLWASIKDLNNRIFYFRPHNDMTFRAIDLTKLPLKQGTYHPRYAIQAEKPTIIDVTEELYTSDPALKQPGTAKITFEDLHRVQSVQQMDIIKK